MAVDMAKAEEKNASLTMKLVESRRYHAEVKVPAVSAMQWGAIQAICGEQDSEVGRAMLDQFRQFVAARATQGDA